MDKKNILLKLNYKVKKNQKEKLRLFSSYFIKKNKLICKIIFKNKIYEIKEFLDDIYLNYKDEGFVTIILIILNNIIDIRKMFKECISLVSIIELTNNNKLKIKNMNGLFYKCEYLVFLPDISKWNTNDVKDMSFLFYQCKSLKSFPNISKWNTNNVKNMSYMFSECYSLISLIH